MTKEEIADELFNLAFDMAICASHMFAIDDENMKKHAKELNGAAMLANEWCEEINKELNNGDGYCE